MLLLLLLLCHRFYKKEDGTWTADKVIDVPSKKVEGWGSSEMQGKSVSISQYSTANGLSDRWLLENMIQSSNHYRDSVPSGNDE